MTTRIIVQMDVSSWNKENRLDLIRFLLDNYNENKDFVGHIIEPANPPPLIPIQEPDDKIYDIM